MNKNFRLYQEFREGTLVHVLSVTVEGLTYEAVCSSDVAQEVVINELFRTMGKAILNKEVVL